MKKKSKRKIGVVTGSRAEYGDLRPLLKKIQNSNHLELQLMVTGLHLLKQFGLTINEINKDRFPIAAVVPMYPEGEPGPKYYGQAVSTGIKEFTEVFLKLKPDIVVVIGDRLEPFVATVAAALLKIPIVHIHGGDKIDSGHIDDSLRHAITRFANIHLPASEESFKRLVKMGEERWRIYKVGSPALETILNLPSVSQRKLELKLKVNFSKPLILCLFHPVHLEVNNIDCQMREILEAIKELRTQTVIIYPNNDEGSEKIISEIKKYAKLPFIRVFASLSFVEYLNLLRNTNVLVGNTSSGITQAPSFKLGFVHVGSRNKGREHVANVIFVAPKRKDIKKAIKEVLYNKEFKKRLKNIKNPYGDGKTSGRILKILNRIKIDGNLLNKKITY